MNGLHLFELDIFVTVTSSDSYAEDIPNGLQVVWVV